MYLCAVNEQKRLLKNSTIYAVGTMVPRLLAFVSLPILTNTNLMPVAQNGIVAYVTTWIQVLSIVGVLSLNTYYLVHYSRAKDEAERRVLLGSLSTFVLGFNVVLMALFLLVGPWLSNVPFFPYMALGALIHLTNTTAVLPTAWYRMMERPLPLTLLSIGQGTAQLAVMVVLVAVFRMEALGVLSAQAGVGVLFSVVFLRLTYKGATFRPDWELIRRALRFSLPLLPGSLAYFVVSLSDRLWVEKYLSISDLAIYNPAAQLAMVLQIVSYAGYKAFEPVVFKNFGRPEFDASFARLRNAFVFVLLVGVLGLGLFAQEFFDVMSSKAYNTSYRYTPLLLVGVFCYAVSTLYATVVAARGKTKTSSAIMVVGGTVAVALYFFGVSRYGLWAAASVSGIVFGGMLVATIRASGVDVPHRRTVLAALLSFAVVACGAYGLDGLGFGARCVLKAALFAAAAWGALGVMGLSPRRLLATLRQSPTAAPNSAKS